MSQSGKVLQGIYFLFKDKVTHAAEKNKTTNFVKAKRMSNLSRLRIFI